MSDPKHSEKLRQGLSVWNQWRVEDLESPNLAGIQLVNYDLAGADFRKANLAKADLSGANLNGTDLSSANLSEARLSRVNLSRANLCEANLYKVDLFSANLTRTNLSRADLSNADLAKSDLSRADLSRANLKDANLSGANLFQADLSEANLLGANLTEANVDQVTLTGATGLSQKQFQELISRGAKKEKAILPTINETEEENLSEGSSVNAHSFTSKKNKAETFKISILHPRKLAKGFSTEITINFFLPHLRIQLDRSIKEFLQETKNRRPVHTTYGSELVPGKKVLISLSSPHLDFSKEVPKTLEDRINRVSFLVMPLDSCRVGKQAVRLAIIDKETKEEYCSLVFILRVEDYAFGHVSKPLLSFIGSFVSGTSSASLFLLTYFQEIDKSLGLSAGSATLFVATALGLIPTTTYKHKRTTNRTL